MSVTLSKYNEYVITIGSPYETWAWLAHMLVNKAESVGTSNKHDWKSTNSINYHMRKHTNYPEYPVAQLERMTAEDIFYLTTVDSSVSDGSYALRASLV